MSKGSVNVYLLTAVAIFATILYNSPPPPDLNPAGWKLFSIFIFTIVGIILKVAPMGTLSIMGMAFTALSMVVAEGNPKKSIEIALSGFGNSVIWLIVLSFFISRGFIKTGLGARLAYMVTQKFGKSPLGIAYSLNIADLILAPAIPSNTARGGGIVFPVMQAISQSFDSNSQSTRKRIAAYLTLSVYNGNLITSSMFLTATAGNPMAQKFAADLGVEITWGDWALAGLVPGLIALIVMPWLLYYIYPPSLKDTSAIQNIAHERLKALGPMKREEKIMLGCFFLLLGMWVFGNWLGIDATTAGLIGLSFLLLSSVLDWEEIKAERGAWDTLVWFSALVMMGSQLNALGFIPWVTSKLEGTMHGLDWKIAFPLILLAYSYSHYLFASATAHIASMYAGFLSLGLALGVPGKPLALMLAIMTSLMGTQTHYGHGPAPVFYGNAMVDIKEWWGYGFVLSLIYFSIFVIVGMLWWELLGSTKQSKVFQERR